MNWKQVCDDPTLQNLPYKIELNEWGQIVMSPASNKHGRLQVEIAYILKQQTPSGSAVITESSISTTDNTKVADVVWCSETFIQKHGYETPFDEAPEICIEIISPSNSAGEMKEKIGLYFSAGAKEVWLCTLEGIMTFYLAPSRIAHSNLIPNFPSKI